MRSMATVSHPESRAAEARCTKRSNKHFVIFKKFAPTRIPFAVSKFVMRESHAQTAAAVSAAAEAQRKIDEEKKKVHSPAKSSRGSMPSFVNDPTMRVEQQRIDALNNLTNKSPFFIQIAIFKRFLITHNVF